MMGEKAVRITEIYEESKQLIEDYMKVKSSKYTGFDFDFKPYSLDN